VASSPLFSCVSERIDEGIVPRRPPPAAQ